MDTERENDDPRMTTAYVRRIPGGANTLTLVGVVHDHPSSTYRVKRTIEERDPDILALELPPISIPLFEEYARCSWDPPRFGGEMSAAIQTARTDTVVGIDRPTGEFFGRLLRKLLRDRPPWATIRAVLSNLLSVTTHAVVCRLAAAVAFRNTVRLGVDIPVRHEIDWRETPLVQAHDERKQVRQSRAFLNAFGATTDTRASRLEDAVRESHMADRLSRLRERGDAVGVVGVDHLDPLAERLAVGASSRD